MPISNASRRRGISSELPDTYTANKILLAEPFLKVDIEPLLYSALSFGVQESSSLYAALLRLLFVYNNGLPLCWQSIAVSVIASYERVLGVLYTCPFSD
ncbi:hypothetical protein TNCV_4737381 [Trichonephila clavipes]|nr:hypothetical protein TNCV_4737381 [Trichonephila clavipes]